MSSLLDPDREVFANAPLQLVACEIAYRLAPGTSAVEAKQAVYEAMEGEYPLPGPAPQSLSIQVGPGGHSQQVVEQGFRFLARDSRHSVVVTDQALTMETSAYDRFEDFAARVASAVAVVGRYLRVVAVERIGLRYIDEIPLASLPEGTFDGYFSTAAMAGTASVEGIGPPDESITTASYTLGDDLRAVLRTGPVRHPIVNNDGPLRIAPSSAPLFIIDIDSAWEAQAAPPLEFDAEAIGDKLGALHGPIRTLFYHAITEKLREDVLRKEKRPT